MIIRHTVTGQEIERDFRQSMGFWQQDTPRLVSYSMDQWEEVPDSEAQ